MNTTLDRYREFKKEITLKLLIECLKEKDKIANTIYDILEFTMRECPHEETKQRIQQALNLTLEI